MANKTELIKEVAQEIQWTQADVVRAVECYDEVTTKEEIIACCLHYAGSELKKRSYQLGAQKRVNNQQKIIITNLIDQITKIDLFYKDELIPNLKSTISAQAERIEELLKQVPWANNGGKNE